MTIQNERLKLMIKWNFSMLKSMNRQIAKPLCQQFNALFVKLKGPLLICLLIYLVAGICETGVLALGKPAQLDPERKMSQQILDSWTARNNLSSSTVTSIIQTRDGYLWMATFNGLARFDGMNFTIFNKANTPILKTNSFWCLHEDSRGRLWIGSNGGGLYLRTATDFIGYGREMGLTSDVVRSLCTLENGDLGVGTQEGIQRFDGFVFTSMAGCGIDNVKFYCTCLSLDSTGKLWAGTRNRGAIRISDGKLEFFSKETGHIGANQIYQIMALSDGVLVGTYGDGIHYFTREGIFPFPEKHRNEIDPLVTAIFKDNSSGAFYIGTEKGLFRYFEGNLDNLSTENGLTDNTIQAICMDHESSMWIGTWRGGLCRIRTGKFLNYTMKEGLPANIVHCTAEDSLGRIWIGTQEGLALLQGDSFRVFNKEMGILPNNMVRHIQPMRDGTIWISTYGGIAVIDGNLNLERTVTKSSGLSTDLIRFVREYSDNIWIGTREGLNRIHGQSIEIFGPQQGLGNSVILSLLEDTDGSLWIGTDGGGLSHLKNGVFNTYTTKDGLASNIVFRTLLDTNGDLWISSNNGLTLRRNGKFHIFTMREGMPSDVIFQILESSDSTLWFTSSVGVFSIKTQSFNQHLENPQISLSSTLYGTADGMCGPECTGVSAAMKDSRGRLWFPTLKGISVLDPSRITLNSTPPKVEIEEIRTEEKLFNAHEPIVLEPGMKDMEIQYTALSFAVPEKVRFNYRLLGYDEQWVNAGQRRSAYYTNLPPGKYVFQVKACNNDGFWSPEGTSVSLTLNPFFYQTGWFRLCLCIAFGILLYALFKLRLKQLDMRNRKLEELVRIRTDEITLQAAEISRQNSENERLLLNILPKSVATRLKSGEKGIADFFPDVTILFCDIVGFTSLSSKTRAAGLVEILNMVFSQFDNICLECGIEKIKTIGDGYMAAGGLPEPGPDHCLKVVLAALRMLDTIQNMKLPMNQKLQIRIGIHTGPVVAGVIGSHKFIYDLWGDTVNIASRMESHGIPGTLQVSQTVAEKINNFYSQKNSELKKFELKIESRTIHIKGKGEMDTFLITPLFQNGPSSIPLQDSDEKNAWFRPLE
jgi:ligand-binding sensor domain-containing protein/class 3 adenylate cyclase